MFDLHIKPTAWKFLFLGERLSCSSEFFAVVCEGVVDSLAEVVWVCAHAVGFEGIASWGYVACAGASVSGYVFNLVSC